jgi:hypothetical protein
MIAVQLIQKYTDQNVYKKDNISKCIVTYDRVGKSIMLDKMSLQVAA